MYICIIIILFSFTLLFFGFEIHEENKEYYNKLQIYIYEYVYIRKYMYIQRYVCVMSRMRENMFRVETFTLDGHLVHYMFIHIYVFLSH